MNDIVGGMCEDSAVALLKVLSMHLRGRTEESLVNLSQDNNSSNQRLNPAPPEYKTRPHRYSELQLLVITSYVQRY